MTGILWDLSSAALVHAIDTNALAYWRLYRHWSRAEVYDGPDLLWVLTDLPHLMFNAVGWAGLAKEQVEPAIEAMVARATVRGVPFGWFVGPTAYPANVLRRRLDEYGFEEGESPYGMALDLEAWRDALPPISGLHVERLERVERVRRRATVADWSAVCAAAFGTAGNAIPALEEHLAVLVAQDPPPMFHYLARVDGVPLATATLLPGAGVCGIYDVGTIPGARRQGLGAAITAAALADAQALGYRAAILHASEMGRSVYAQLGFREYCRIESYIWE